MLKQIIILLFLCFSVNAQNVTGTVTNLKSQILAGINVKLYSGNKTYNTTSDLNGKFSFIITSVEKDELPTGYQISNNYPNPFNPITRINILTPRSSNVKVELFNSLGQKVRNDFNTVVNGGNAYIDLELNGLPNGVYFAKITLDEKHFAVRKLLLLYGSQHLTTSSSVISNPQGGEKSQSHYYANASLNKTTAIVIDSLVLTSPTIAKMKLQNITVSGNSYDFNTIAVNEIPRASSIPLQTVREGSTLDIDLTQYVSNDNGTLFSVSNPLFSIVNGHLRYTGKSTDDNVTGVVTFTDAADSKLTASTNVDVNVLHQIIFNLIKAYDVLTTQIPVETGKNKIPISGLKVTLGSDNSIFSYTDASGNATFSFWKSGTVSVPDSMFVTDPSGKFYNYRAKINLQNGVNNFTSPNMDGVGMIERFTDSYGDDLLNFMVKIVYFTDEGVRREILKGTQFEDVKGKFGESGEKKIYVNRANAPNSWVADSAKSALEGTAKRKNEFLKNKYNLQAFDYFKITEVNDSASSVIDFTYNPVGTAGKVSYFGGVGFDGPYVSHATINLNLNNISGTEYAKHVAVHEGNHIDENCSSGHSIRKLDMLYSSALERLKVYSIKTFETEKEIRSILTFNFMGRNMNYIYTFYK